MSRKIPNGKSLPWFPFFPADWRGSPNVQQMTAAERGVYIDLLAIQWEHGDIPSDPALFEKVYGIDRTVYANFVLKYDQLWTGVPGKTGRLWNPKLANLRHSNNLKNPQSALIEESRGEESRGEENKEHRAALARVWEYYLEKLGKNPKLLSFTPLRQHKGMSRLREALKKASGDLVKAESLLMLAVDSLAKSDFHLGINDQRKRYDSWEKHLFPNQEKLEWWWERA